MNTDLKHAFSLIKPVCDVLMICPSPESITAFMTRVSELKNEVVQELQQYLLFPLITHVKSTDTEKKMELQWKMVDGMRVVLEKVTVNSYEMCMKIETGLLHLIFDSSKPGMNIPEELKHSAMRCLTVLMLNINVKFREKLLKTQVPLLAQVVFVSVHIAKLERLRALRLAAINCVTAHTATHVQLTTNYQIKNAKLEILIVDMLSSILPGVLAALQDVAMCTDNPGHVVVVAAVDAIHRILCVTMQDKYLSKIDDLTMEDFAKMVKAKQSKDNTDVSNKDKNPKDVAKRSPEWYTMAGEKLTLITKSLISLKTHEHFKVRKELAVFCSRLLIECNRTMQPSIPIALDVLLSLAKDEYPEVSQYSADSINTYFSNTSDRTRQKTMDSLCDNMFATLTTLPRVLNNIDSSRKLSALNLVHGYVWVLCDEARPQRLTAALSLAANMQRLCVALGEGARHDVRLAAHHPRSMTLLPPINSPWSKLRHLDTDQCEKRLQEICQLLGNAECAELVLDRLLEMFHHQRKNEIAYIMNWMGSGTNSSLSLVKRILNTYLEEDVWYIPLELGSGEAPLTSEETLDVTVYNPRAWIKDSVPGLYEGAIETRYTDISLQTARVRLRLQRDATCCATLAEAQNNLVLSCLLTEGVGIMARRLTDEYQPYLLRTLCLILERIGSKYDLLHLAGLKAINDIAIACGHYTVGDLIKCNADYFTHQITIRLKKAWNCQSALQILSVVLEYSDTSVLDCLYGIVEDVLVQSCDKYYEKDLHAYLQVFLTFVDCIRRWFPLKDNTPGTRNSKNIDILEETREYIKNQEESERLLSNSEFESETGKSVEEMYKEDLKRKEEDELDYDDKVTHEKPPLPQHIKVTITILKRCLNFVTSKQRDNAILALQVLTNGLPVLRSFEDELLPLVHLSWSPLAGRFQASEPVVMRRAFELLVTLAALSKDFIRSRSVKDVMPHIYAYLHKSAKDSYLKDAGSAYRNSQAYNLQVTALKALPTLAVDLGLVDENLEEAMTCADAYLSNKQPKPLQASAISFFIVILDYDYGSAWYHLRKLCNNEEILQPPKVKYMKLEPVVGTPFRPTDKDYEHNIKLIFEHMVS